MHSISITPPVLPCTCPAPFPLVSLTFGEAGGPQDWHCCRCMNSISITPLLLPSTLPPSCPSLVFLGSRTSNRRVGIAAVACRVHGALVQVQQVVHLGVTLDDNVSAIRTVSRVTWPHKCGVRGQRRVHYQTWCLCHHCCLRNSLTITIAWPSQSCCPAASRNGRHSLSLLEHPRKPPPRLACVPHWHIFSPAPVHVQHESFTPLAPHPASALSCSLAGSHGLLELLASPTHTDLWNPSPAPHPASALSRSLAGSHMRFGRFPPGLYLKLSTHLPRPASTISPLPPFPDLNGKPSATR